jgi:hypothetical protein
METTGDVLRERKFINYNKLQPLFFAGGFWAACRVKSGKKSPSKHNEGAK